jgi:hypothetical protein
MPFSYDKAWADLTAMFRANWLVLLTITGAFVFFPGFALFTFLPLPEPPQGAQAGNALTLIYNYYTANIVWFVLVTAITTFAQGAMLVLLLDRARPTVGEALALAARLFPALFLAQVLTNLAIGAGMALFIVPGIYLLGRLVVVAARIAERRLGNPIQAIAESWALTDKRGWRIAGLVLLVALVAWIAFSAAQSVMTIAGSFVVPADARHVVAGFANALSSAALNLMMVVLGAAIYRQLTGDQRMADVFG